MGNPEERTGKEAIGGERFTSSPARKPPPRRKRLPARKPRSLRPSLRADQQKNLLMPPPPDFESRIATLKNALRVAGLAREFSGRERVALKLLLAKLAELLGEDRET